MEECQTGLTGATPTVSSSSSINVWMRSARAANLSAGRSSITRCNYSRDRATCITSAHILSWHCAPACGQHGRWTNFLLNNRPICIIRLPGKLVDLRLFGKDLTYGPSSPIHATTARRPPDSSAAIARAEWMESRFWYGVTMGRSR